MATDETQDVVDEGEETAATAAPATSDAAVVPPDPDAVAEAQVQAWFDEDDAAEPEKPEKTASEPPVESVAEDDAAAAPAKSSPVKDTPATPASDSVKEETTAAPASDFDLIAYAHEDIPETIKVKGKDVPVSQLITDFPELVPLIADRADRIVQARLAPVMQFVQQYEAQQSHSRFIAAVEAQAPDVRQVIQAPEFRAWVDKQPAPLKKMAMAQDVDSAVFVLSQYRQAKAGAPPARTVAAPALAKSNAFEKKKAVHAGTLGGKAAPRGGSDPDPNDYDAAWDEEDRK